MNYIIDFIDTENNDVVLSLEKAARSAVVLDWQGGDVLEELDIIGSKLSLELISRIQEDVIYKDLITGDENKYRVRIYDENNVDIWSGFLLPDVYSEPYKNGAIPVELTASDGLGRLKGKYLPEDYYSEDKSVIDVISTCLRQTGLELDLFYSPAIENSIVKSDRHQYLDTSKYKDKEDKDSAYDILKRIIKSKLSILRQVNNRWNVEGFNVVNSRVYTAERYDYEGNYIEDVQVTRNIKKTNNLATPNFSVKTPYGRIEVVHEREEIEFPETITKEENDGWVNVTKQDRFVYATDWIGHRGLNAKAFFRDDYAVSFGKQDESLTYHNYISLRRRIYLRAGEKYSLKLGFQIERFVKITPAEDLVEQGLWDNPFEFSLKHLRQGNLGLQVFSILENSGSKKNIDIIFDNSGKFEETFEFTVNESGLLDIQIKGHENSDQTEIDRIVISELEIEQLGFEDEEKVVHTKDGYTREFELELPISDDYTAFSDSFMLGKVNDKYDYESFDVEILSQFEKDGFYYAQVTLEDANLVKENIDELYYNGVIYQQEIEVIYNIFNSEQHVIKSPTPLNSTGYTVRVYNYNSVKEDRTYWERWTDSKYNVEQKRYNEVAKDILVRLTDKNIFQSLDLNVKNNIKINDFIIFEYADNENWIMTNCRWDIDGGFSDISITEQYYSVSAGENIPPVVEAGDTIYFENDNRNVVLNADAFDPDGFIVSYFWEVITGSGGNIASPNSQNTNFNNLTDDFYTLKVTVTDNDGATASDTVYVMLRDEHELVLNKTAVSSRIDNYAVGFNPDIPNGAIVNLKGNFEVYVRAVDAMDKSEGYFRIKQNGQIIREIKVEAGSTTSSDSQISKDDFSVSYYNGNDLEFELEVNLYFDQGSGEFAEGYSEFTIEEAEFVQGQGEITNFEQTRRLDG